MELDDHHGCVQVRRGRRSSTTKRIDTGDPTRIAQPPLFVRGPTGLSPGHDHQEPEDDKADDASATGQMKLLARMAASTEREMAATEQPDGKEDDPNPGEPTAQPVAYRAVVLGTATDVHPDPGQDGQREDENLDGADPANLSQAARAY